MHKHQQVYGVIMAGGVGSRFWPRSRERSPKQLLEIIGKGTMIQNTVQRISEVISPKNILIVTNKVQKPLIVKQLPGVPAENVIVEPIGRNTAPCIGLAALFVRRMDPQAVMVVLPADHLMQDEEEFRRVLKLAIEVAQESKSLVTIGIHPTRPETGYGYIQIVDDERQAQSLSARGVFNVKTFAEKPNLETAKEFLKDGNFFWNSGMFIWRADVILAEIERQLPEMHQELVKIDKAIGTKEYDQALEMSYRIIRSISIDYGVMEKARNVYILKGNFGWSDVGSWDEVKRISGNDEEGNCVTGRAFLQKTKNSYIYAGDSFVAAIGVEDLIVIATGDGFLVCKQGYSQEVKEVVDYLRRKQFDEYL